MSNSPDIWSAVNGLNQQGYEGALGAATIHQTHPGNYSSLQPPHSHLVRFAYMTLFVDGDGTALFDPCRFNSVSAYCARTTLHIQWWLLKWTGVSHPCPPFTATTRHHALHQSTPRKIQQVRKLRDSFLLRTKLSSDWSLFWCFMVTVFLVSGSQRNVSGGSQTGDTLGKALASVSMHHLNPIRPSMPCYVKHKAKPWETQWHNAKGK